MRDEERRRADCDGFQKILLAAEELFADRGFDAVSMLAIANAAGISKANIYHYFPNKDALYLAVIRSASQNLRQLLQKAIDSHGSVVEALRYFAVNHLLHLLSRPRLVRLVLREILEKGEPRAREMADSGLSEVFGALVAMLRRGQHSGELRPDFDPTVIATMLISANVFFFQSRDLLRLYPDVQFTETPEAYAGAVVDVLLHSLRSPH